MDWEGGARVLEEQSMGVTEVRSQEGKGEACWVGSQGAAEPVAERAQQSQGSHAKWRQREAEKVPDGGMMGGPGVWDRPRSPTPQGGVAGVAWAGLPLLAPTQASLVHSTMPRVSLAPGTQSSILGTLIGQHPTELKGCMTLASG